MARSLWGLLVLVLLVVGASRWWAQRHQLSVAEQVAAQAGAGDIHMLSSDHCVQCDLARRWMLEHGVAFSECSIERDARCRQLFEATRAPGTPVVLVRGQAQLGFSAPRVLQRLQRSAG
jgi:glutaredoxin